MVNHDPRLGRLNLTLWWMDADGWRSLYTDWDGIMDYSRTPESTRRPLIPKSDRNFCKKPQVYLKNINVGWNLVF
jgi:hypothetical protein